MKLRARHLFGTTESCAIALLILMTAAGEWLKHHDPPWIRIHQAVAYTALCRSFKDDGSCATKRTAGPKQNFTIIPAEQKVIQTIGSRSVALQSCEVLSRRDWHCTSPGVRHGTFVLSMENGDFDTTELPTEVAYTPYWHWRLLGGRD